MNSHATIPNPELANLLIKATEHHSNKDYLHTFLFYEKALANFSDEMTDQQKYECMMAQFASRIFLHTEDLSSLFARYETLLDSYKKLNSDPFPYEMNKLHIIMDKLKNNLIEQAHYQSAYACCVDDVFSQSNTYQPLIADIGKSKHAILKSMMGATSIDQELRILINAVQAIKDNIAVYESSRQKHSINECNDLLTDMLESLADKYADSAFSPTCQNQEEALLKANATYKELIAHLEQQKKEVPLDIHLSILNMYEELAKCTNNKKYTSALKKHVNDNKIYTLSKYIKDKAERKIVSDTLLSHLRFYNDFKSSNKRKNNDSPLNNVTASDNEPKRLRNAVDNSKSITPASDVEERENGEILTPVDNNDCTEPNIGLPHVAENAPLAKNNLVSTKQNATPSLVAIPPAPSYSATQSLFSASLPTLPPAVSETQKLNSKSAQEIFYDASNKTTLTMRQTLKFMMNAFNHSNPTNQQLAQLLREIARVHRKSPTSLHLDDTPHNAERSYLLAQKLYEMAIALAGKSTTAEQELTQLNKQLGNADSLESTTRINTYINKYRQQKFRLFQDGFNDYIKGLRNDFPKKFNSVFYHILNEWHSDKFTPSLRLDNEEKNKFNSVLIDAKKILQRTINELNNDLRSKASPRFRS